MERFEYISSLGEGAYGTVWLCMDRETNQQVALKRFKDAHSDPEVMRLALREVRLLKAAQHPSVVGLVEAFRSKSGRVYIAMEYIERTLTQDLRKYHGKGFPPLLAKWLAYQLLQGVQHMHMNKIMHRDLKPANILLTANNELKMCDFGFARTLHHQEIAEYTTYVVTRWYRAPEILVSDTYGPEVDVWAIGCLLAEMVGGRPLFPGKSSADQMWLTIRTLGDLPTGQAALMATDSLYRGAAWPTPAERTTLARRFPQFPGDLLDLLHGCLALDPTKRLDTAEALAHPYFADVEELKNAIAASEQPASVFWDKIEDAWLSAVAANGNVVSSPHFMKTNKSHANLAVLLMSDTEKLMNSMCNSALSTPQAPRDLVRRGPVTGPMTPSREADSALDTMATGDFTNVLLNTSNMLSTANFGPMRGEGSRMSGSGQVAVSRSVSRAISNSGGFLSPEQQHRSAEQEPPGLSDQSGVGSLQFKKAVPRSQSNVSGYMLTPQKSRFGAVNTGGSANDETEIVAMDPVNSLYAELVAGKVGGKASAEMVGPRSSGGGSAAAAPLSGPARLSRPGRSAPFRDRDPSKLSTSREFKVRTQSGLAAGPVLSGTIEGDASAAASTAAQSISQPVLLHTESTVSMQNDPGSAFEQRGTAPSPFAVAPPGIAPGQLSVPPSNDSGQQRTTKSASRSTSQSLKEDKTGFLAKLKSKFVSLLVSTPAPPQQPEQSASVKTSPSSRRSLRTDRVLPPVGHEDDA